MRNALLTVKQYVMAVQLKWALNYSFRHLSVALLIPVHVLGQQSPVNGTRTLLASNLPDLVLSAASCLAVVAGIERLRCVLRKRSNNCVQELALNTC